MKQSVLVHIKDLTPTGAPAYTADKQLFRTDIGDIIALFALDVAAHRGMSRISSTCKVYNDFAETVQTVPSLAS